MPYRNARPQPSRTFRHVLVVLALTSVAGIAHAEQTPSADQHLNQVIAALQDKRLPEAWWHIRQATRKDPSHPKATQIFMKMWASFDKAGLANSGHSVDNVIAQLGRPDAHGARGREERVEYGYIGLDFIDKRLISVVDLRGMTNEIMNPNERVEVAHDGRPWRLGHRQASRSHVNTEYILPGQTVQDWIELFSVSRSPGLAARGVPLQDYAQTMRDHFSNAEPNGVWNVLSETDTQITYEFIVPDGSNNPQQHEVASLLLGQQDIHRVAYSRRGPKMPDEQRAHWVARLSAAQFRARQDADAPDASTDNKATLACDAFDPAEWLAVLGNPGL